jgi:hypothetical protein
MSNTSGNAYALTALCPIKPSTENNGSGVSYTRTILQSLPSASTRGSKSVSPLANIPNTYLARLFILDDTIFQSFPHRLDQLKSEYLVFVADFHGTLDVYLKGMYEAIKDDILAIWKYCYGFDEVVQGGAVGKGQSAFVCYIRKCQMETTFYFNGSTDDSLNEQLKSLYLKQEFSKFVFQHQGAGSAVLLADFKKFMLATQPNDPMTPTWQTGKQYP